ncbi:MAG TPA: CDP-diacylglycerol--serine O-phosphatidyltransferase [Xanthomonadaceae bacterium]|nr:CDP-diacylglycerol--serine O-phosphatidyltransferase [Xanthomonadaceae bacterium]
MSAEAGGPDPRPRRGIYLLPNLFTTGGLFAGFYAIIAATGGHYGNACVAVLVAGLLDGIDGRVARLTGTQSEFGSQYDSLADLVSFGMAPALVMYHWALAGLTQYGPVWGKIGWTAAFLYAACAALRLARFNIQTGVVDKRWFIGLASPAAAALMVTFIWSMVDWGNPGKRLEYLALGITVAAAGLMVSRVRYFSFKTLPVADRVPFIAVLIVVVAFVLLAVDPPTVLFGIALAYALSGPAAWLWGRWRRHRRAAGPDDGEAQ